MRKSTTTVTASLPWSRARFQGATINIAEVGEDLMKRGEFGPALEKTLEGIKAEARKGVWMKVPMELSSAIELAAMAGVR